MKKSIFTFCVLTSLSASSVLADSLTSTGVVRSIEPICVHPSQFRFQPLNGERASLNINFYPITYWNDQPGAGFDYTEITESQYQTWSEQCKEGYNLEAYIPTLNSFTIFKVKGMSNDERFSPGGSSLVCQNQSMAQCDTSLNVLSLLNKLSKQTHDQDLKEWMANGSKSFMINISDQVDDKGSFIDHDEQKIQVNILDLGTTYLAQDSQSQVRFSLQRLLVHEVIHAANDRSIDEAIVIGKTNQLLSDLKFTDQARQYEQHADRNTSRYSFIQAAPPPAPGAGFIAFFNRPTKEFVSDPWMWFNAFLSVPTMGRSVMNLSNIASRIARSRAAYTPLGTSTRAVRTQSVTSTSSVASSVLSSSESIETASIETLSSQGSSIETASIETLADDIASLNDFQDGDSFAESGPLSQNEQLIFADRVDEEVAELSIDAGEKMHMQFALSPSAHYLNQAPELARAFIRGDITVEQLYNNMPI